MRKPPSAAFQVARDGVDVTEARVSSAVATGLSYGLTVQGWVPEYELYSAMRAAGYIEETWSRLAWPARARAVAHHRLAHLVSLHEADAVAKAQRRASNA